MAVFLIGFPPEKARPELKNPLREALRYHSVLENGDVSSQAELAKQGGVSRARITQVLNLLKLDPGIQDYVLGIEDGDSRLVKITGRKLQGLLQHPPEEQRAMFWTIVREMS